MAAFTVGGLARFLRNPVKEFFRQRLQVVFPERRAGAQDDESFASGGLDRWQLLDDVLEAAQQQVRAGAVTADALPGLVALEVARLKRAGRLPMAGPGAQLQAELVRILEPMLGRWHGAWEAHPRAHEKCPLRLSDPATGAPTLDDWGLGLRSGGQAGDPVTWIELQASRLADKQARQARPDKLLAAWVRSLALAACGQPAAGILIGADAVLHISPCEPAAARETLDGLLQAAQQGLSGHAPLPTAVLTGLAFLKDPGKARPVFEGHDFSEVPGEGREACLARLYPDFATLLAEPAFGAASQRLYAPYRTWLDDHITIEVLAHPADVEGEGDD